MLLLIVLFLLWFYTTSQWNVYGALQETAQDVQDAQMASSPSHESSKLELDTLPKRYWQPTYPGEQPVFTTDECRFTYDMPRLKHTDLNPLQFQQSLRMGRTNLIEPLNSRKNMAQFLNIGVRTKRDVYTQPTDDISNICENVKAGVLPKYVNY